MCEKKNQTRIPKTTGFSFVLGKLGFSPEKGEHVCKQDLNLFDLLMPGNGKKKLKVGEGVNLLLWGGKDTQEIHGGKILGNSVLGDGEWFCGRTGDN